MTAGVRGAAHRRAVTRSRAMARRRLCWRLVAIEFAHRTNHGTNPDQHRHREREAVKPHNPISIHGPYSLMPRSLRAFPITETELKVMAALAMIGLRSRPNAGYRTPAATGTPRVL